MSNSLAKDKISKITLNNRRRLYFLGYTIIILLIVAISYRYSQKTPKKILEAYENTHSINHRADAISQLLQKSKLLIYQYLANTDSKKIPAFKLNIMKNLSDIRQNTIKNGYDYQSLLAPLEKLTIQTQETLNQHESLLTAAANNPMAAISSIDYKAVLSNLQRIQAKEHQRNQDYIADLATDYSTSKAQIPLIFMIVVISLAAMILMVRSALKPTTILVNFLQDIMLNGAYSTRLNIKQLDQIGEAGNTINLFLENLQRSLEEVNRVVTCFSRGNYSTKLEVDLPGELSQLKENINKSVDRMQNTFRVFNLKIEDIAKGKFDTNMQKHLDGELHTLEKNINNASSRLAKTMKNLIDSEKKATIGKILLQEMELGVLVIEGDLTIHEEYSEFLTVILGQHNIAGRSFREVILDQLLIGEDAKDRIESAITSCLDMGYLNFNLNKKNLIKEVGFGRDKSPPKTLEITWQPVTNATNMIERIIVIIRDISIIKTLEKNVESRERENELLIEITSIALEEFEPFIIDCKFKLGENRRLLARQKHEIQDLNLVYRNLHTIKGHARGHTFKYLTEATHAAEQDISSLANTFSRSGENMLNMLEKARQSHEKLQKELNSYHATYNKRLTGFVSTQRNYHKISDEILGFLNRAKNNQQQSNFAELGRTVCQIFKRESSHTVKKVAESLLPGIFRIAEQLGVSTPKVVINCDSHQLTPINQSVIKTVLLQCMQNSIVHGFRSAQYRLQPENNQINIDSVATNSGLKLTIQDNGKGLDLHEIKYKIRSKGLDININKDHDVAQAILYPEFSTQPLHEVTIFSGRGVGLDIVQTEITKIGGKVSIILDEKENNIGAFHILINLSTMPNSI